MKGQHLFLVDIAGLVLIGDRLDPIGVAGLFGPRPLGFTEGIKVIAIPDIEAKFQIGVAPFDLAVKFAIEIFVALQPETLPEQHFWIGKEDAHKFDQRAIDKVNAGARLLKVGVQFDKGFANWLDRQAPLHCLRPAMFTKTGRGLAGDQLVEWAAPFVAPHNAVDGVAATLILDQRVPPAPVVGMVGTGFRPMSPKEINFQTLGQIGNIYVIHRAMSGIFKERFHQFGHDFHATGLSGRDDHFQYINAIHLRIICAELLNEGILIIFWVWLKIGTAFHGQRFGYTVIRPAIERMRDTPPGFQPKPGDGPDHQDIDTNPLSQCFEHIVNPFIDKTDGADLDTDKFLVTILLRHGKPMED